MPCHQKHGTHFCQVYVCVYIRAMAGLIKRHRKKSRIADIGSNNGINSTAGQGLHQSQSSPAIESETAILQDLFYVGGNGYDLYLYNDRLTWVSLQEISETRSRRKQSIHCYLTRFL